jgi:3-oxoacyl-[acyl-carrier protein] reductase
VIVHCAQILAFQLAGKGIRASTVIPGDTYFDGGVWQSHEANDPTPFADSLAANPNSRMAHPSEITNGVEFPASCGPTFVAGTHLAIRCSHTLCAPERPCNGI